MSVLLSHFIPASAFPLCPQVRSLRLRLYSCSATRFISTVFLDSIYVRWHTVFVFLFLTYFTLTDFRSIHLTTNNSISFLFYGWVIFHCIYMCHIFFIQLSVDGHLGCFHVLAIVNSAAMNIVVHVSFWIMFFSGYMPGSGIAGSYGSSIFFFNLFICVFIFGCFGSLLLCTGFL